MQELINRAKELLADGTVARVLGWKAGDLPYNPEPAYFEKEEDFADFVYNGFCGANLSKYMIEASKLEGKTLVCLKPCDTYSYQELLKGTPCGPRESVYHRRGLQGQAGYREDPRHGHQRYQKHLRRRDRR